MRKKKVYLCNWIHNQDNKPAYFQGYNRVLSVNYRNLFWVLEILWFLTIKLDAVSEYDVWFIKFRKAEHEKEARGLNCFLRKHGVSSSFEGEDLMVADCER